jgi:hypothetical protein
MSRSFRKPDLNAPRFRPKCVNLLNRELFEKFLKRFPEHEGMTLQEFKEIIQTFNGSLWQGVIDNRDGVELPEGLGYIFMASCPPAQKTNLDIGKSLEYGMKAKHNNLNSDSRLLKIFYTNRESKYPFANKQIWAFKGVKQFRQAASAAFREQWQRYIVVDNYKKVSSMFAQIRKRDFVMTQGRVIPEGYDEFKM